MTQDTHALVRALHAADRRVCVVTDFSEAAVRRCLTGRPVSLDGIHGRGEDLSRLMPHPGCLLRALHSPGARG